MDSSGSPVYSEQPSRRYRVIAQTDLATWLGMTGTQIVVLLGEADERTDFTEDHVAYLTYLQLGLSILLKQEIVDAVFAYSGRIGGYETMNWSRYQGTFACGLHFDMHLNEVVSHFGQPEYSSHFPDAPIPFISHSYSSRGVGLNYIEASGEIIYVILFEPRTLDSDIQVIT